MGPKRKAQHSEPDEAVHASRQLQVYGHNPKPAKKPRRTEPPIYKKQAHASSVNAIKKRIRDVTRKLERSADLPANVRIEDERALAAYHQELAAAEAEKVRQKMIKKYHMVRFFERQKATRQLKRLRKRLLETESTDEVAALKEQMRVLEVDLNYTQFCPLSEPYVSLYPQKDTTADEEDIGPTEPASKPAMWAVVEKHMEEGTLSRLRNRASTTKAVTAPKPLEMKPAKPKLKPQAATLDTTGMNRRQRRSQGVKDNFAGKTKNKSMAFERNQAFGSSQANNGADEGEDDSDGGFFEE
ncbi:rRNA-processing efg1 [Hyphodiscus hymeniophilus]|uniref:rRNA-processing protein EFG1 n=1 Tax=Hyphodiscus hymeniophilus TaxID=353542 RepID=A0A9P6VQK5_9HELO|nr:rRNA-processing efg1 [Hyphodiscus hymeniophilus]